MSGIALIVLGLATQWGPALWASALGDATDETALPLGLVGVGVLAGVPLAWRLAARHPR